MAPSLAFEAMQFARYAHANQVRKYTGNPYSDHLAEVAGIVATVPEAASLDDQRPVTTDEMISVAWLHDCIEDQGVDQLVLLRLFGENIRFGVVLLSDLETGNRAQRKDDGPNQARMLTLVAHPYPLNMCMIASTRTVPTLLPTVQTTIMMIAAGMAARESFIRSTTMLQNGIFTLVMATSLFTLFLSFQ